MSIVVSKTGSVVYAPDGIVKSGSARLKRARSQLYLELNREPTKDEVRHAAATRSFGRASQLGDQHNAYGILKWLGEEWPGDVHFVGKLEGTPPPGVTHFDGIHRGELNFEWDDVAQQRIADRLIEHLRPLEPRAWIDICGSAASKSWIDNPDGIGVQLSAARYIGPSLYAMECLQTPRICIVTDMRNYPRNHEMTWWKGCTPVAVLGQENRDNRITIRGRRYDMRSVYAGVENWFSHGMKAVTPCKPRSEGCVILAHSHLNDARWRKNREKVWTRVFTALDRAGIDWRLHGSGWEEYRRGVGAHWAARLRDPVDSGGVFDLLQTVRCGFVLSPAEGFLTTKVRKYALMGALPLLWDSEPLRYDPTCLSIPDDCAARVRDNEMHGWNVDGWSSNSVDRIVQEIELRTRPDFRRLKSCIVDIVEHPPTDDHDVSWWMNYGGYRKL